MVETFPTIAENAKFSIHPNWSCSNCDFKDDARLPGYGEHPMMLAPITNHTNLKEVMNIVLKGATDHFKPKRCPMNCMKKKRKGANTLTCEPYMKTGDAILV